MSATGYLTKSYVLVKSVMTSRKYEKYRLKRMTLSSLGVPPHRPLVKLSSGSPQENMLLIPLQIHACNVFSKRFMFNAMSTNHKTKCENTPPNLRVDFR